MSLATALDRIETVLTGTDIGLQRYEYQLDQDNLEEAPARGTFDDGYHLRIIEGPSPYQELCLDPIDFVIVVEIQVATEIKNQDDRTAADKRLGVHLHNIAKHLVWPTYSEICNIFEQGRATSFTRDGQRLVTSLRLVAQYREE